MTFGLLSRTSNAPFPEPSDRRPRFQRHQSVSALTSHGQCSPATSRASRRPEISAGGAHSYRAVQLQQDDLRRGRDLTRPCDWQARGLAEATWADKQWISKRGLEWHDSPDRQRLLVFGCHSFLFFFFFFLLKDDMFVAPSGREWPRR